MPVLAMASARPRAAESIGPGALLGQYSMVVTTGSVTTIAAATASAGHLFAFRWTDATRKCWLRYVAAQFMCTTGFTAGQEVAVDLCTTRSYSASHSSGTAIDMGGTNTNANKLRVGAPTSLMAAGDCRVSAAAALTNGTHTIDVNAIGMASGFAATTTTGLVVGRTPSGTVPGGVLYDSSDDDNAVVLTTNEGFLIRNLILMGAAGVGTWKFWFRWDEGTVAP